MKARSALTKFFGLALAGGLGALPIAYSGIAHAPAAHADIPEGNGAFQTFRDSGGYELNYHRFEGGNKGIVIYLDGDGTTNYNYPETPDNVAYGDRVDPYENGHVQRMRVVAAAYGFDLYYFDHPESGRSWWNGIDADRAAVAMREFVAAANPARIQFVGYSGGSEFLARHLLITGPVGEAGDPTRVAMIGGGGVAARTPAPANAAAASTSFHWIVGESDTYGAAIPAYWSALESSKQAQTAYAAEGYENVDHTVLSGVNHLNYPFGDLVASELATLANEQADDAEQPNTGDSTTTEPTESQEPTPTVSTEATEQPTPESSEAAAPTSSQTPTSEAGSSESTDSSGLSQTGSSLPVIAIGTGVLALAAGLFIAISRRRGEAE